VSDVAHGPLVIMYLFNAVHVNLLILKGDSQIYFVIIIISSICSAELVIFLL
jgi:hypothetical protein